MERTFHMLLYRAFHAQRSYLRPCLGEIGLVVGQPKLITYLACHGPCGQRELAEYFEVDSAAVSRWWTPWKRAVLSPGGPTRRTGGAIPSS